MVIKTIRLNLNAYDKLNAYRLKRSAKKGKLFTFEEIILELLRLVDKEQ